VFFDRVAALYAPHSRTKVLIWGGTLSSGSITPTGSVYDSATDRWSPLPSDECAPPALSGATLTAFGNGHQALIWGGQGSQNNPTGPCEQGWVLTLDP
jgi:hypothetical protein